MSCGMVRKVDELGRVVIPKEMRRILNIKTGSSIEMSINGDNQVVLKKFSELANIISMAQSLVDIIFDMFDIPCFLCDDEKVLCLKGLSKKDFLNKSINALTFCDECKNTSTLSQVLNGVEDDENCFFYKISSEGFEIGHLVLIHKSEIDKSVQNSIEMVIKFFEYLANF